MTIRIEFWNGQLSNKKKYIKYDGRVTTSHNPCLWSDEMNDIYPWRSVYPKAMEYISKYRNNELSDTDFLHGLRYIAYGYNNEGPDKRDYNNIDVIWPGNLTCTHLPRLVVQYDEEKFTIDFYHSESSSDVTNGWKTIVYEGTADFFW